MARVDMCDLVQHASRHGYAVPGFDIVSLDFLSAVVQAAESARAPAILSLAETHFKYYDFDPTIAAVMNAATQASVPLAVHFDHGTSLETVVRAINRGCNGVMLDASERPFTENVAATREAVESAHACGVAVEGKLGFAPDIDDEQSVMTTKPEHTSVDEAAAFVERTGVDFLAVSIGTAHGRPRNRLKLNLERLKRLHQRIQTPLVIHGGTGLTDEQFRKLIAHGVARINYYTALNDIAGERIRANRSRDRRGSYTDLLEGVREAIQAEVERCLRLCGAAGRAAEVQQQCRPWGSVRRVLLGNFEGRDIGDAEAMMARERERLSSLPGVRQVVGGRALSKHAPFRFCWMIEFVHPEVLAGSGDHPDLTTFTDQMLQPATDPLTIDFADLPAACSSIPIQVDR
jgi:fructose-bisphosphate aldolase class II